MHLFKVHFSYGFCLFSLQEDNKLLFVLLFTLYLFMFLIYHRLDHENLTGFIF